MRRGEWARHPLIIDGPPVIAAKRLETIGVSRSTISRRCAPGGTWRMLLPGVVLLQNGEPTDEQKIHAALLHCGPGSLLTGVRALQRYGLRCLPETQEVHILVPAERSVTNCGFVRVERTRRLPKSRPRGGVPTVPVPRAVIDAARRTPDRDAITAMMAESVQRGFCLPRALSDELDEGRTGKALLRCALTPILGGARSVAEADAWRLWQRSDLPEFRWNVKIFAADGTYIAQPDGWCDELGFAWEIDSLGHHAGEAGFRETLARNARYAAAGIVVLQTLPSRLRSEPGRVMAELRAALDSARLRPRPGVRLG
ncbi:hypothetical protein NQK81_42035 [Amycolatopsis roodepoortensis]|uniref:hypothetical protein n=1 Tax=Amycolatopsis roodepoortensis TaxID=700274 RepID=UPI00214AEB33|nr:hypothetical protein [Amycolatopsis roodepoortensis]UUV31260.1 hypothetical protein NQK81_42035 [Amycolatopsis roodepoortensis]